MSNKVLQQSFWLFTMVSFLLNHFKAMAASFPRCSTIDWVILAFWLMFSSFLLGLYVGRKFKSE